jgi:hypothetical protein
MSCTSEMDYLILLGEQNPGKPMGHLPQRNKLNLIPFMGDDTLL